jgi:hypothetical protein
MTIGAVARVTIHEVAIGGKITGVASDGVDSGETVERGQVRKHTAGTVGGLFAAHDRIGWMVRCVSWQLPSVAAQTVTINLVDDDSVAYQVATGTGETGTVQFASCELLVPPGWKLQVVAGEVCDQIGRVAVFTDAGGWSQTLGYGVIGRETRVS